MITSMKGKILLAIAYCLGSLCSQAQVKLDTIFDKKQQIIAIGKLKKGQKQGAWIEWDMINRVSQVDSFLNGQKHGMQDQFYYQNAARKTGSVITCDYVHGKKQGLYQVYYDSEQKNLKEVIAYEADTVGTLWETYHQYNELKTERIYINRAKNTYLLKTYEYVGRNNFLTEASHYKNDTLHGTSIQYWLMKDDQIRRRATYSNGRLDGKLEVFGKDGTLEWEAVYLLGELIEKKDYKKTVNQYKGSDYSGYR